MKKRLLTVVLAAGVLVAATTTGFTIPVAAQQEVMWVQLPTGEIVPVEVPPGTDPASMELPGPIVPPPTTTEPPLPRRRRPRPRPSLHHLVPRRRPRRNLRRRPDPRPQRRSRGPRRRP